MDAESVAEIVIRRFYHQHGLLAIIISEPKPVICEHLWKKICKILGIQRKYSTIYHPQIDGATKRINQTMETFLRIHIYFDQPNWVKFLFITEFVINNKKAVSTGINFFFLTDINPKSWKQRKNCMQRTIILSNKHMG